MKTRTHTRTPNSQPIVIWLPKSSGKRIVYDLIDRTSSIHTSRRQNQCDPRDFVIFRTCVFYLIAVAWMMLTSCCGTSEWRRANCQKTITSVLKADQNHGGKKSFLNTFHVPMIGDTRTFHRNLLCYIRWRWVRLRNLCERVTRIGRIRCKHMKIWATAVLVLSLKEIQRNSVVRFVCVLLLFWLFSLGFDINI